MPRPFVTLTALVLTLAWTAIAQAAPSRAELRRVARACGAEPAPFRPGVEQASGIHGKLATANAYRVLLAPDGREVRFGEQAHQRLWMQFIPKKRSS